MSEVTAEQRRWRLIVLLLAIGLWLIWFRYDLLNFIIGPQSMRLTRLMGQSTEALPFPNYITTNAPKVHFGSIFTYSLGKPPYARYAVLENADVVLLCCVPNEHRGAMCTGIMEPLSRYEQEHVVPRLQRQFPRKKLVLGRLNATRPVLPLGCLLTMGPIVLLGIGIGGAAIRHWIHKPTADS